MADTTRAKAALLENWQVLESSNLYHNQDGRDAVYVLYLCVDRENVKPSDSAYRVRSDWGRRNAMLQTTLKPAFPTTYQRARDIYDTLLKEKFREGYKPSEAMAPRSLNTPAGPRTIGAYDIVLPPVLRQERATSAFICPRCKAPFNKEDEYLGHMEWHNRQDEEKLREGQKRQASGVRGGISRGLYVCGYCEVRFLTDAALREHVSILHNKAKVVPVVLQCPLCSRVFAVQDELVAHITTHVNKPKRSLPDARDIVLPDEKPSLTRKATRKIILDD